MAHNPYLAYADDPTQVIGHATHAGRSGKNNEDLYAVFDTRFDADATGFASQRVLVVAVADGIGGSVAGEMASDLAVQAIATGFRDTHKPAPVRLDTAIRRANGDIYRNSVDNPALAGMGTTIVAAVIGTDQIQVGHAGDSRAYLLRAGVLSLLTQDHSWAQEALEAGRLTAEEARTHPNRHVIKRFLGGAPDLEVDYRIVDPTAPATQGAGLHSYRERIEFIAGDTLLFCTDGLTDVVGDATIATILTKNAPQQAADKLINEANRAGGPDNITVVIVRKAGGASPMAGARRSPLMAVLLAVILLALAGAGALLLHNFNASSSTAAPAAVTAAAVPAAPAEPGATEPGATEQPDATPVDTAPAALVDQPAAGAQSGAALAQDVALAPPTRPFDFSASTPQTPTVRADAKAAGSVEEAVPSGARLTPTVTVAAPQEPTPALPPAQGSEASMSAAEALAAPVVTMRPATSTPVTPTAIATPTPPPTATSQPTTTPVPRSTTAAGDTATPRAAATVTAAATIDRADGNASNVPTRTPGGPTSVTIVGPASGLSNVQGERVTFTWTANEALEAGQGFELHFWQEAEPREMGRTLFGASPDPSVTFAPDITGTRKWGVWLVTINPYKEIRYLGGDNLITISGPPEKEPRKPGPAAPPDPGGGGTRP